MKKLILSLLVLIHFSCNREIINPSKTILPKGTVIEAHPELLNVRATVLRSMSLASEDSVNRIAIVTLGQSNDGIFGTPACGGVYTGVQAFNVNKLIFEPRIDPTNQFEKGLGGFQTQLGKNLRAINPTDSIYFIDFHIGGTGFDVWNTTQGELFFSMNWIIEKAFAQRNFDKVYVIWTHGETDSKTLATANAYQANENALFTYIENLLHPVKILNYLMPNWLPTTVPYGSVVNNGKSNNTLVSGTNRYVINSDSFRHGASGALHMDKYGILDYANALITYFP